MAEEFDAIRFLDEAIELVGQTTHGESGLLGLRRVVNIGDRTLGADAIAIIEFGPASGRIVAASGAAATVLGRRVDSGDMQMRRLVDADPPVVCTVDDLPADVREMSRGSAFALFGRIIRGTTAVGALVACLPDGVDPADPLRLRVFAYLTAVAARLYRESPGLPLHPDPALRVRPDTTVVVDRGGIVRWTNPASRHVLDAAAIEVGQPLPLPMPGPGQVLEHSLPSGRTFTLVAKSWPDRPDVSLTIRDITESRRWEQSRELFVALTSHELRTPVTVIRGYAETLTGRWDVLGEADRRDAVRVLGLRAGELARLLDRLLSAVGEPGVPPVVERFNLVEAVTEALADLPSDLRRRVRHHLSPELPIVFGEPASVGSIVSELVTNAGKYAPPDSGDIEVDGVSDDRTVGIRVSDRGIGVRPEHVESAFERFWQADTGDHRRYGGVGLGLYLVRRIVERQNGWVSLRPRDSGGTVAEVRLPRGDLGRTA